MYVCVYICVFFTARVGGALSAHGGTTPSSAVRLDRDHLQASKQAREEKEKGGREGKAVRGSVVRKQGERESQGL